MKTWQFAVVSLFLLALAGCRTDPEIAYLVKDNRLKEDEIYRLHDQLENCQADLQEAQRQLQAAPQSQRRRAPTAQQAPEASSAPGSNEAFAAPQQLHNGPTGPGSFEAPAVELPKEPEPKGKVPERFQVPRHAPAPGAQQPDEPSQPSAAVPAWNRSAVVQASGMTSIVAARPTTDSTNVARITLNQSLTGGLAASDRPGDQGLMVVIEPRDAQGQLVDAVGNVQVVAIDPAATGPARRAGRWEFTATQAATLPRGQDRGIHLNLPWPDGPPAHHKLHLFVRYLTSDGRRLETDSLMDVALPGDPATTQGGAGKSAMPAWSPTLRTDSGASASAPPHPEWSPERL